MSQLRRAWVSSGVVAPVLLLLSALPAAGQARVSTIQEAIQEWTPETHLYVFGDVGLPDKALAELEAWLEDGHWTVLLVQDATGQSFQSEEGWNREGVDAIEYGTGQGIARASGFPPDGAILSVVLAQRELCYTGSPVHDRYRLGEDAFRDLLDQWAISALRDDDVVSAVKDTVINIDRRLAEAVAAERLQAEMMAIQATRQIEAAAERIGHLENKAEALRSSPPHPSGGLARPDTATLRSDLEHARGRLEADPSDAYRLAEAVDQKARSLMELIDHYPSGASALAQARERLKEVERDEHAAEAREEILHARSVLAAAEEQYRQGDPAYLEQLSLAEGSVANARSAVAVGQSRKAMRRGFLTLLGMFLLGLLARLGWYLNRRLLPLEKEARALLGSSWMALDSQPAVAGLEERVLRLAEPQFAGTTGELIRQVREDLASLAGLHASARQSLAQARDLIRPSLFNLFFSARYEGGIALLRDEPAPFDPSRISFPELMEEIRTLSARAGGALDELESSLRELPPLLEQVNERIWQTGLQKEYLAEGAEDGLFQVPAVFSELLPAAGAALEEARRTATDDPVGTWKGSGSLAGRLSSDAWRLVEICRGARSVPSGEPWFAEGLRALSGRAEGLASRTVREDSAAQIEKLAADLTALQELAGHLVTTRTRIAAEERRVESSRREMGDALGLAPDLLLREEGSDPSEMLAGAVLQANEAEARLSRAEVEPAAQALESADRFLAEAVSIVDASRKMFEERETAMAERLAESGQLGVLAPKREAVLAGIREEFAQSALGKVADNAEELREEIAAARGKLDLAAAGIREGRMLAAASLLEQVRGHQEQAALRMEEITNLRIRLDQAREENRALLVELEAAAGRIGPDLSDPRITGSTRSAFEQAAGRVRTARGWIEAGREDPLLAGYELAAARKGLDQAAAMAPEDRRLHEEASRQIQEADAKVKEADDWSGDYGVVISGRPGAAALEAARELMSQQRYAEARGSALGAWKEADVELEAARAEVARLERERRRRDDDDSYSSSSSSSSSWSSSFSSSSSGSSSSSSSSSSGGSSSGGSTSGGSSSGSGRSGW